MKKITAIILALLMVLSVLVSCSDNGENKNKDNETETTSENSGKTDTPSEDDIIGTSPTGYTVDKAMLIYYTYNIMNEYSSSMGGADLSSSHSYFAEMAKDDINRYVILMSKAKELGYTLTDEEQEQVEEAVGMIDTYAKMYGQTTDEYLASNYSEEVTADTVRKSYTLEAYAYKYYYDLLDSWEISEDELISYRDAKPEKFRKVDIINAWFGAGIAEGATDDEKSAAMQNALKEAEDFASLSSDIETFKSAIINRGKDDAKAAAEANREEFVPASDEEYLSAATVNGYAYSASNLVCKWAFSDERQVGDIEVIGSESGCFVCCLTATPYYDDYPLVNVRHIPIATVNHENAEATKKLAETAYNELINGSKTDEEFDDLIAKYSDDPNSASDGGVLNGIAKGDTINLFSQSFDDWCFAPERKAGDVGMVETSYGYHIIYYAGTGEIKWKYDAKSDILAQKLSDEIENMSPDYAVVFDADKINEIFPTTDAE